MKTALTAWKKTKALMKINTSHADLEILGSKRIGVKSLTFWGSSYDIGHVTISFPVGHFLLVVLWNQASIS